MSHPSSADPMKYDEYIHQYAFSSVLWGLVSTSKKGEIIPMIAKSWSHNSNFTEWKFKIRNDLKFSNGEDITAKDYELSLKRIAFLMKKYNSKSGLLENLVDFESIQSIEGIKSISSERDIIILQFKKPVQNLLVQISFGLYSLAHRSLFNNETGEWKNDRSIISSGGYIVDKWSDVDFSLRIRKNLPRINYKNAIEEVNFIEHTKIKRASDLLNIDMLVLDKNSLLTDSNFEYVGTSEGYKVGYIYCYSWNKKNHPFNNIEVRKWARAKFYEGLKGEGFEITNSFFPPSLPGIKKFDLKFEISKPNFEKFELVTHTLKSSGKIEENKNKKSIQEILDLGLKNIGKDSNIVVKQINYLPEMKIENVLDLSLNGTGIEAYDFLDTVKFMFLSKNGIKLPDATGEIIKELNKENPNTDLINKEIWNQAIVWPVRHYSKGYWFKKNSFLDYSEMNLDNSAIDFQFIYNKL